MQLKKIKKNYNSLKLNKTFFEKPVDITPNIDYIINIRNEGE